MVSDRRGFTTASVEAVPRVDAESDPTPGFVLLFSRLYETLPAALPFAGVVTTLGREPDNTLSIPEAAVSRHHASVERRADGYWILDRGSTNGTVVNGRRTEAHRLTDHDVVRVGDTLFRYAARAIYAYGAYPVAGGVTESRRPLTHGVRDSSLVGGYQLDALIGRLDKVARTELSVVVSGESGTGKELVARELHRLAGRRGAFQAINCAALPAHLIESELFGYRKGAFTGATGNKPGLIRAAQGGTLFLDEIGDMPLEAQAKLLRVLQEREVLPLGATVPEPVDVRVVCATHRDLEARVSEGSFRGDLLARLREVVLPLPPLRARREDTFRLVRHFLARAGRETATPTFSYMLALAHYGWPYNVRELESAVKLSLALAEGDVLDLAQLPGPVQRSLDGHGQRAEAAAALSAGDMTAPGTPVGGRRRAAPSEEELRALLEHHGGNLAAVGRALGKARMQIHRWLDRYGIRADDYRDR